MQPLSQPLKTSFKQGLKPRPSNSKQTRDLQRLLKLDSLSADARVELERKLKTLVQTSQDSKSECFQHSIEKSHMEKYRMLRFFEKKKALKRLKAILSSNPSQEEIENASLNLNYVVHFPKDRKYISLYPNKDAEPSSNTIQNREKILISIKAEIISGKLSDAARKLIKRNQDEA